MPRVLGIDPGTVSIDVCGLEDGRVFLDRSLPAADVADAPERMVELVEGALPLDLVVGPSGYGLPLVPMEAVGEPELALAFLAQPGARTGIGGLRALVRRFRELRLPVIFLPGVVHLPTVPPHRKVNRIDLGTADKVCAAALALDDHARRLDIPYTEASFVLVELGGAFTAVLAVERGRIVDGLGGSSGALGYRSGGAMDAEVACLLGEVGKDAVFSGGAAFVAGTPDAPPEALAERTDPAAIVARQALVESTVKAVAAELAIVPDAREILLSGRLCGVPGLFEPIAAALSRLAPARRLEPIAPVSKSAAQGAALLADGLAGGGYRTLVDVLELRGARGTPLDHLFVDGLASFRPRGAHVFTAEPAGDAENG